MLGFYEVPNRRELSGAVTLDDEDAALEENDRGIREIRGRAWMANKRKRLRNGRLAVGLESWQTGEFIGRDRIFSLAGRIFPEPFST